MPVVDTLRAIPLFSELREGDIDRLAFAARERSYPKNSVILFEDDPGDALFVVVSGQVKVVLTAEDGREVILSVRDQGDFFGEMAVVTGRPRSATVEVVEEADLLKVPAEKLQEIVFDTGRGHRPMERDSAYVQGLVNRRLKVTASLTGILDSGTDSDLPGDAVQNTSGAVSIVIGTAAGSIDTVALADAEISVATLDVSEEDPVAATIECSGHGSSEIRRATCRGRV